MNTKRIIFITMIAAVFYIYIGCTQQDDLNTSEYPDYKAAGPSIDVYSNINSNNIRVRISFSSWNNPTKYNIYRSESEFGDFELITTITKEEYYYDSDIEGGRYYYYKATGYSPKNGESQYSLTHSGYIRIDKPVISTTINNSNGVTISWTSVSNAEYYKVRMYNENYEKLDVVIVNSSPYIDNGLPKGSGRYYVVTAHSANPDTYSSNFYDYIWGYRSN